MLNKINILVVEDKAVIIDTYTTTLKTDSLEDKIHLEIIRNKTDAIEALRTKNFDAAIIDLRLDESKQGDKGGNDLIDMIHRLNYRYPIYVLSGYIPDLDTKFEQNFFLKVCEKGKPEGDFSNILSQIISIHNTGVSKILGGKGDIEKYLNEVFNNHIANSMEYWREVAKESPDNAEKTLLRYTLAHIKEYLELTNEDAHEDYHPIEFYIYPPIKAKIFTGDILQKKSDKTFHVVLTPACNFANNKADSILINEIVTLNSKLEGFLKQIKKIEKKKEDYEHKLSQLENEEQFKKYDFIELMKNINEKESKKKDLEKQINGLKTNSQSLSTHYLPETDFFVGGFIDFQKTSSISKSAVSEYDRILTISSEFIKDIIARFSHYYARQGQPNLKDI